MPEGRRRAERGQLAIPALLAFPVIFLFVMLIVQVNRLSREKIRQQFSIDIASTIEAEQYADLLNRMAYINGIFPQRLFADAYGGQWGIYYNGGLYPGTHQNVSPDDQNWHIRYGPGRDFANTPNPPERIAYLTVVPPGNVLPTADDIAQVSVDYVMIYRWLGRIAVHQKEVFEQMTEESHPLARKAFWVNLSQAEDRGCAGLNPTGCYGEATQYYPKLNFRFHYIDGYRANCHCPGNSVCDIAHFGPDTVTGSVKTGFNFYMPSLFQLETIPTSNLQKLKEGWQVKLHWLPPTNSYGVDFSHFFLENGDLAPPYVRGWVSVAGGAIWPDPMPRFRTRLNP